MIKKFGKNSMKLNGKIKDTYTKLLLHSNGKDKLMKKNSQQHHIFIIMNTIKLILRNLINDNAEPNDANRPPDVFTYTNSNVFRLSEPNIDSATIVVYKNRKLFKLLNLFVIEFWSNKGFLESVEIDLKKNIKNKNPKHWNIQNNKE